MPLPGHIGIPLNATQMAYWGALVKYKMRDVFLSFDLAASPIVEIRNPA